jgi:uncharacterized membrane protein YedE/YeeE
MVAGIGIGLLQIPAILLLAQPLGSSSNIVALLSPLTMVSWLKKWVAPCGCDIECLKFPSTGAWKKILSAVGAICGAFVAAYWSFDFGRTPGLKDGLLVMNGQWSGQAFVGGILLMLGARLAGGCTSGHGISGFGLLVSNSLISVPCMFGAAILTAFTLLR